MHSTGPILRQIPCSARDRPMSLESDAGLLARLPLFAVLDREPLRLLAFQGARKHFAQGAEIARPGETLPGAMIVVEGAAGLFASQESGPVKILRQGGMIGSKALIVELEYPYLVRAMEPTEVMTIPRDSFCRIMAEYPDAAVRVRAAMAADLQKLNEELLKASRRF